MVRQLTPKYEIVCDRCGKKEVCDENGRPINGLHEVFFNDANRTVYKKEICDECAKELHEFAENFFDEVNRVNEDKHKLGGSK